MFQYDVVRILPNAVNRFARRRPKSWHVLALCGLRHLSLCALRVAFSAHVKDAVRIDRNRKSGFERMAIVIKSNSFQVRPHQPVAEIKEYGRPPSHLII